MSYLDNVGLTHFTAWVKARLAGKQNKLDGQAGQFVGFDSEGTAVPVPAPEGDLTLEEADGRYLKKTGGETGKFAVSASNDEHTMETNFSIAPDHLNVGFFDAGETATITADQYGVTFNGDPLLTEQALNSALDAALPPMQEELAAKVSVDEFQNAMADGPWLPLNGGEMMGPLSVNTPTASGHAATKGYVDAAIQTAIDGALAASY